MATTIEPAEPHIPAGLVSLLELGTAEGIGVVSGVLERWDSGEQRFDNTGETLLVAVDRAGLVVGIGGITPCPHVEGALRMRRFYVDPRSRRHGVAGDLARALIEQGFKTTSTITCNARASDAAAPFWESLGFSQSPLAGITHVLYRV